MVPYLQKVVFSFLLLPISPDINLRMDETIALNVVSGKEHVSSMVSKPRELSLERPLLSPGGKMSQRWRRPSVWPYQRNRQFCRWSQRLSPGAFKKKEMQSKAFGNAEGGVLAVVHWVNDLACLFGVAGFNPNPGSCR